MKNWAKEQDRRILAGQRRAAQGTRPKARKKVYTVKRHSRFWIRITQDGAVLIDVEVSKGGRDEANLRRLVEDANRFDQKPKSKEPPEGTKVDERLRQIILERVQAKKGYWPVKKPKKRK